MDFEMKRITNSVSWLPRRHFFLPCGRGFHFISQLDNGVLGLVIFILFSLLSPSTFDVVLNAQAINSFTSYSEIFFLASNILFLLFHSFWTLLCVFSILHFRFHFLCELRDWSQTWQTVCLMCDGCCTLLRFFFHDSTFSFEHPCDSKIFFSCIGFVLCK